MKEMSKILYIGMELPREIKTGGEYCVSMNKTMLQTLYGKDNVIVVDVPKIPIWRHICNLLLLRSYGYTNNLFRKLRDVMNEADVRFACVDGAYYGGIVELLNKRSVKTVVFCHNVEYDFSRDRYRNSKSFFNWALWKYMWFNEKKTFRFCSHFITLNQRDSDGIFKLYGRNSDMILPSFYFAKPVELLKSYSDSQNYLLFVGSNFFANNDGILWFVKEVSNHIGFPVWIAGSCCYAIENKIDKDKYPNVKFLGFVDDIETLYINATGVIGPIFAGSGMKTKTVEAMMYGKNIYATPEAFEGICGDFDKIGALCNTKDDFINAIQNLKREKFNEYTYSLFMNSFSADNAYSKFSRFVEDTFVK